MGVGAAWLHLNSSDLLRQLDRPFGPGRDGLRYLSGLIASRIGKLPAYPHSRNRVRMHWARSRLPALGPRTKPTIASRSSGRATRGHPFTENGFTSSPPITTILNSCSRSHFCSLNSMPQFSRENATSGLQTASPDPWDLRLDRSRAAQPRGRPVLPWRATPHANVPTASGLIGISAQFHRWRSRRPGRASWRPSSRDCRLIGPNVNAG
jgi:hypothetical protein